MQKWWSSITYGSLPKLPFQNGALRPNNSREIMSCRILVLMWAFGPLAMVGASPRVQIGIYPRPVLLYKPGDKVWIDPLKRQTSAFWILGSAFGAACNLLGMVKSCGAETPLPVCQLVPQIVSRNPYMKRCACSGYVHLRTCHFRGTSQIPIPSRNLHCLLFEI